MVVDASTIVDALVQDQSRDGLRRRLGAEPFLDAPSAMDLEVLHTLRRLVIQGRMPASTAALAVGAFAALQIRRHGTEALLGRIWQLRHNLTAYDAAYVALAEALGVTLLTADARISTAPGLRCSVEVA
jgi:predicted nucleic acid-binding protein